jgi:hypothetical protein
MVALDTFVTADAIAIVTHVTIVAFVTKVPTVSLVDVVTFVIKATNVRMVLFPLLPWLPMVIVHCRGYTNAPEVYYYRQISYFLP